MIKVLVTGGAGFIGSHIVDELVNSDFRVAVVDNMSTGLKQNVNSEATLYDADIRSDALGRIFELEKPHLVIHQAAQVSVRKSVEDPLSDASTNIQGTVNVLDQCIRHHVEKIVYASSAATYGDPQYIPVDEGHRTQPGSPYALSKLTSEAYVQMYAQLYELKYTILRYSNVYGPRQNPYGEAGVVSIFINQVLEGLVPEIFGNGEQTRDFVYVTDVARANVAALFRGDNVIANISTGKMITLNRLLSTVNEVIGEHIDAEYMESRPGDIVQSCLNNRVAKHLLGWEPLIELKSGLEYTTEYFKSRPIGSMTYGKI